jgi:hypothetical protein
MDFLAVLLDTGFQDVSDDALELLTMHVSYC